MAENNNGVIKTNLDAIEEKLGNIKNLILGGKRKIAYAIKANGIDGVEPSGDTSETYMTFQQYADLILRLRNRNAMILEFTIPSTAKTNYKRTIVLPMNMTDTVKLDPSNYLSLNAIATEIINSDTGTYAAAQSDTGDDEATTIEDHIVTDSFGNKCIDGTYTISIDEINRYLTPEQRNEFIDAAVKLNAVDDSNYTPSEGTTEIYTSDGENTTKVEDTSDDETAGYDYGIATEGLDDAFGFSEEDGQATTVGDEPVYAYTVDWGDGTTAEYTAGGSYPLNKAAIWHTYAKAGTYDVSITGNFRKIFTGGYWNGFYVVDGEYKKDKDGTILEDGSNYGMRNHLTSVIAWGNTKLTSCCSAFRGCKKLSSIPMYDTTNSFEDVTDFSYIFQYCPSLKSLPFNENTNRGLFSNCKKATTFSYAFCECIGLTNSIPYKLIDGCSEVTNVSHMFDGCVNLTGSIPFDMFSGLTKLTTAASVFGNCNKLNGTLSTKLFKDCPNVTDISRLFYNCTGLEGTLTPDMIGNLSGLKNARQAFCHCKKLTGIESGAFKNIKGDGINFRETFCDCGFTAIPDNCISDLTGKNLMMERMFADCVNMTYLAENELANLKVANARGMFDGCTSLACTLTKNPDWESETGIKRWYSAFVGCVGANYAHHNGLKPGHTTSIQMHYELNGLLENKVGGGGRIDKDSKVGMIALSDGSFIEPDNSLNADKFKEAFGVVYADVILNNVTSATLGNGVGNVKLPQDQSPRKFHKIYICALNDDYKAWIKSQNLCENITTIQDTSDTKVAYNLYEWGETGSAVLKPTRYCGEAYDRALSEFIIEKGYADKFWSGTTYNKYIYMSSGVSSDPKCITLRHDSNYTENGKYIAFNSDGIQLKTISLTCEEVTSERYPAISAVHTRNENIPNVKKFLPDSADLWDQYVQRGLINVAMEMIKEKAGLNSTNCYPLRLGTYYWSSAEHNVLFAWNCELKNATIGANNKTTENFVRPSFAITVS